MLHPVDRGHFPEVIDNTIVSGWKTCPTKTYFEHFLHLGSLYPSVDLIAGGALATGLEHFRKCYYGPKKMDIEQSVRFALPKIVEAFGNIDVPAKKENKGLDRVIEGFIAYLQKYPPHTDHIQPFMIDGEPSVEFTFSLPLPFNNPETGQPLIYGGRFDLLGVYRDQLFVVDEKTTSTLGATWSDQWNMRSQFSGYCYAAREFGRPVVGAIVRGIAFYKKDYGFEESIQMRNDDQLSIWYEEMLATVADMIQAWQENRYHQNLADACYAYFKPCAFQQLCSVKNYKPWITGKYGYRKWNPLAKVAEVFVEPEPAQQMDSISLADAMKGL